MNDMTEVTNLSKLLRQDKKQAISLGDDEARFLVSTYYRFQEDRIRADNQIRSISNDQEPHAVLTWLAEQSAMLEEQIKGALDVYSKNHKVGKWLRSITGIGPVIASGLLSHIDIKKAPTVGHIWSFAGLVPGVEWKKGERRPWNAELRKLLWLCGESFVKVSSNKNDVYGKIYKERKELEIANNEKGIYAPQAQHILATKNIGKDTDAYKAYSVGKLPPAHIHARAKRYAVKLLLSHLHHVWYVTEFGRNPPNPYPIEHMGHAHIIAPPNFPMT